MIWPALYVSVVLLAAPHGASKNPDAVRAQALTNEARHLMTTGDYGSACTKFASSQALDPAPGTAMDLASCYEKAGKLASAVEAFHRADAAASAANQKGRATTARKRAAALQARLSYLTIRVPAASQVASLEVRCGGEAVDASQWGIPVARDGGGYDIEASAPGKNAWSTHVEVKPSKESQVVDVPALEDARPAAKADAEPAPAAAVAETPKDDGDHPGQTQRLLGLVVGGAGVVTIGVGGVVALMAKSQMSTAESERGLAAHNDSLSAQNSGNLATVLAGAGAAVAVAGAVIWLTAPSAPVTVGTNGSTLLVRGSF